MPIDRTNPDRPAQDLFAGGWETLELPGATIRLHRNPDLGSDVNTLFQRLWRELRWREDDITLFGKTYRQPRLLAWYGDPDAVYVYSGRRQQPLPWHPGLAALRERLAELCGASFNSVLANLYRDHRDSMGLHADDEPSLGPRPVIASLSLGETRLFRLRHRHRRDLKPVRLPLESGSLLVMSGDTQMNWKHEIPKERRPCGPRINLTFRQIHSSES